VTVRISYTVYMDQRDVTPWVDALEVLQERRQLYRQARIAFRGWFPIALTGKWDIYGSTDPAVPRSSLLLRRGIIAPDQQGTVNVRRTDVTNCAVTIYDWAWVAQRITPCATIVAAATVNEAIKAVAAAGQQAWPVGRWQYLPAKTMHDAVRGLAQMAGFTVELHLPNYELAPTVVDPRRSIWEAIWSLVEPFRPEAFFRRERNALVIADGLDVFLGIGGRLQLTEQSIISGSFTPQMFRHLRRVIVRIPPWRS
jgi:hypothetical protein